MLAQTSAAQFHPTLKKIIPQWHWAVLVLCFQHMQMLSELYCIQKSFFHDSFPPNFGVLQFKFYWKFHWKHALLFHLFLFQKPEAFFHANRCHEPSYLLIHFDALLIIWNSAVACSFTLLTCTSQSDKKSFMKRHDHQPPFFRRKILLLEFLHVPMKSVKEQYFSSKKWRLMIMAFHETFFVWLRGTS